MLVLSRKVGEEIQIGKSIVRVQQVRPGSVRLGVEAPGDVSIVREELVEDAHLRQIMDRVRRLDI
jgi:carbon storage regulator CsrA